MQTILFIDGENFIKKLQVVLKQEEQSRIEPHLYDFKGLIKKVLQGIKIDKKIFYFVRLKEYTETREKSRQLIESHLGSSDSDLQPAIAELKNRNVERIYLGFENSPNKGLAFTTSRTILIRNSEILEFIPKTLV